MGNSCVCCDPLRLQVVCYGLLSGSQSVIFSLRVRLYACNISRRGSSRVCNCRGGIRSLLDERIRRNLLGSSQRLVLLFDVRSSGQSARGVLDGRFSVRRGIGSTGVYQGLNFSRSQTGSFQVRYGRSQCRRIRRGFVR